MPKVILDNRISNRISNLYIDNKYDVILTRPIMELYPEISGHTDIQFCKIDNKIIYAPNLSDRWIDEVKNMVFCDGNEENIEFIKGSTYLKAKYPNDIAYNVCTVGMNIIGNFKYVDEKVIEIAKEKEYNFIDVKQGYTRCSIAVIDDNSCITNEQTLAGLLRLKGIDAIAMPNENIKLIGKNNEYSTMYGFIGGAMGRINDDIILYGDMNRLRHKNKVVEFIEERGKKLIDIPHMDIVDYGSCIVI